MMFVYIAQAVAGSPVVADPFFSNDFEGWLKVGGLALSIVGAVWWFLRDPLSQRIRAVETDVAALDTKVDTMDRDLLIAQKDIQGVTESFDIQQAQLDTIQQAMNGLRDDIHTAEKNILERLAFADGEKYGRRSTDKPNNQGG